MREGTSAVRRCLVSLVLLLLAATPAGAHDDAITIPRLSEALKRGDHPAERLLLRAELERGDRLWAAAKRDLDRAARLVPGSAALARCRAALALDRDRPREALRALADCTDPELASDPRVPWQRVDALTRLGRLDEAAAVADQALSDPQAGTPERYLIRASLAERRPGEGAAGAVAILAAALERWPGTWNLLSRLVDLDVGLERYDDALARIDEVLSRVQRPEGLLERRGQVLALAGREWEAREAWTAALAGLEARPVMNAAARQLAGRLRASLAAPLENGGPP